ncbi:MAG: DUF2147 domain-containing protein [Aestuariivita sp.]|nr:DUF2147 domain-containing protein [Aestuariivita sp.]
MKYMSIGCLLVVIFARMAVAEPVLGTWVTSVDDGGYSHIEMSYCGENICGVVKRTFNNEGETDSPTKGKTVVIDMVPQGGGVYKGKVWRPSNDKIYFGRIKVEGDSMALHGCIAGGLFCAKRTWTRLK